VKTRVVPRTEGQLSYSHYGDVVAKNDDLKVITCDVCGYAHLKTLPTKKEIDSLYLEDNFYEAGGKAWFAKERGEYEKGLWNPIFDYQISLLESRYVLDVGAGAGWFVHRCRATKAFAWAIEPSRRAKDAGFVRGQTYADLDDFAPRMNDTLVKDNLSVRACLVLEHILNPLEFLTKLRDFVGHRLMIITPNEFNPLQKRVGGSWFVSKHHLNYFNPVTLRSLLYEAGFDVVFESVTFPMELFLAIGLDYRKHPKLGGQCHTLRLRFEKLFGNKIFVLYQKLYRKYGWGRELVFVAEKE